VLSLSLSPDARECVGFALSLRRGVLGGRREGELGIVAARKWLCTKEK
jgi:hypothetical protein